MVLQDFEELGGDHKGNRQQLHSLIGGVSVHHALVTRAALIHAKSDVRALLLHKNLNLRTRIQEVVVSELVETDALEHVVHQLLVVRFVRAGQLTGNDHDSILDENLDGDSGVLVVLEHILWDILKYLHTIFEIQFLLSAPSLTPMAEQLWRFCYT